MEWTEVQALQSNDGVTGQQDDATTLVSNTGQTSAATTFAFNGDFAQGFETGSNTGGYKLTSVTLQMVSDATTAPTYTVTIHEQRGSVPPREPTTNPPGHPGHADEPRHAARRQGRRRLQCPRRRH